MLTHIFIFVLKECSLNERSINKIARDQASTEEHQNFCVTIFCFLPTIPDVHIFQKNTQLKTTLPYLCTICLYKCINTCYVSHVLYNSLYLVVKNELWKSKSNRLKAINNFLELSEYIFSYLAGTGTDFVLVKSHD